MSSSASSAAPLTLRPVGKRNVTLRKLARLARALKVDLGELLCQLDPGSASGE